MFSLGMTEYGNHDSATLHQRHSQRQYRNDGQCHLTTLIWDEKEDRAYGVELRFLQSLQEQFKKDKNKVAHIQHIIDRYVKDHG